MQQILEDITVNAQALSLNHQNVLQIVKCKFKISGLPIVAIFQYRHSKEKKIIL